MQRVTSCGWWEEVLGWLGCFIKTKTWAFRPLWDCLYEPWTLILALLVGIDTCLSKWLVKDGFESLPMKDGSVRQHLMGPHEYVQISFYQIIHLHARQKEGLELLSRARVLIVVVHRHQHVQKDVNIIKLSGGKCPSYLVNNPSLNLPVSQHISSICE